MRYPLILIVLCYNPANFHLGFPTSIGKHPLCLLVLTPYPCSDLRPPILHPFPYLSPNSLRSTLRPLARSRGGRTRRDLQVPLVVVPRSHPPLRRTVTSRYLSTLEEVVAAGEALTTGGRTFLALLMAPAGSRKILGNRSLLLWPRHHPRPSTMVLVTVEGAEMWGEGPQGIPLPHGQRLRTVAKAGGWGRKTSAGHS